jgi:lipid-binding SYLF domain-containing protein
LEAAALIKRNDLNEAFYGRPVTPEEIVLHGQAQSPAAEALRATLNGR